MTKTWNQAPYSHLIIPLPLCDLSLFPRVPLERDNSEEFLKREARAAQLAEEIEASATYKARVALENDERSEEEKYTAVVRGERETHTLSRWDQDAHANTHTSCAGECVSVQSLQLRNWKLCSLPAGAFQISFILILVIGSWSELECSSIIQHCNIYIPFVGFSL